MFLAICIHQFGWLLERGGNILTLHQKEGGTQKEGGFPQKKRGVLTLEKTMLIFWIKSQSCVTYKSIVFKRAFNVVLSLPKTIKQLLQVSLFLLLSGISLK